MEGAPTLAMFKKTVSDVFEPAGVSLPIVYEVDKGELNECLDVIHQSFRTVAEQFGLLDICRYLKKGMTSSNFITLLYYQSTDTRDLENFYLIMRRKL